MSDHHSHYERSVYQLATLATHFASNGKHDIACEMMKYSIHLADIEEENDD